jgi:hypothetical protein
VQSAIEERQRKIAAAEQEIEHLKREVNALSGLLDATASANANATVRSARTTPRRPRAAPTSHNGGAAVRRGRKISPEWQAVMDKIAPAGKKGVDIDQIAGFCEESGIAIGHNGLRSQMFNYVKKGRLVRTAEGLYASPSA